MALASNYMWGFFPEVALSFIMHGFLGYSLEEAMAYPTKLYGMIGALLIYMVLIFSAIRPLQRFIFHREKVVEPLPLKTLLLFICFPIGQTLLLFACTYSMATGLHALSIGVFLFSIFLCAASDVAMFYTLVETAKKNRLEQQLAEAEYTARIQENEYKNFLTLEQRVARYRHDNKNRVSAIASMLRSGHPQAIPEVLEMLDSMLDALNVSHGAYCANLTVDSILAVKHVECDREHIILQHNIMLPEDLPIKNIHLCSIFSNIVDNAISACKKLPAAQREISLSAVLDGGFLFVKEENPLPQEPLPSKDGLGLKILRSIAKTYDGEVIIEQNEKSFQILVALSLEKAEQMKPALDAK
ncbi:MAG TPA: GHKL domain-containing protein [Candidatus Ruthenibacterium merdigallinarum]|nr:GHKL domain-containing protein [Candidatus Ruthenibacterium merdigallinarum]